MMRTRTGQGGSPSDGDVGQRRLVPSVPVVMVLIGSLVILLLLCGVGKGEGRTIIVDDDGEGDYTSIQDAIDNATDGDTIRVWEGVYNEKLAINKSVSLAGNGSKFSQLVSKGLPQWNDVIVTSDWVNVTGFFFNGTDNRILGKTGLVISSKYITISQNKFQNFSYGVYINRTSHVSMEGNELYSCWNRGILVENSTENQFTINMINGSDYGLFLDSSHSNTINDNHFTNSWRNGLYLRKSRSNTILHNSFNNNTYGLTLHTNSTSNTIFNNSFEKNTWNGMMVTWSSNQNSIGRNFVFDSGKGIEIIESEGNVLYENECEYNQVGFSFSDAVNSSMNNNTIMLNTIGIFLTEAMNCTFTFNTIVNNLNGIHIGGPSKKIKINENDIFGNERFAINSSNYYDDPIDARNNYWGDATGPRNRDDHYHGNGDNFTGNVLVDPWYESSVKEKLVFSDWNEDDGSLFIPVFITGVLSVSLLGIALHREDLRFLLLSLLALPLYTRLHKDDILSQSARNDIYSYISNKPGANYSTIKQGLNFGTSSMVHHLNVLQREGYIRSKKEMGQRFFFPRDGQLHLPAKSPFPTLPPSPVQERIIEYLKGNGPKTRTEIRDALSLKQQTVSYSIRALEKRGSVKTGGKGKNDLCELVENK